MEVIFTPFLAFYNIMCPSHNKIKQQSRVLTRRYWKCEVHLGRGLVIGMMVAVWSHWHWSYMGCPWHNTVNNKNVLIQNMGQCPKDKNNLAVGQLVHGPVCGSVSKPNPGAWCPYVATFTGQVPGLHTIASICDKYLVYPQCIQNLLPYSC